MANGYPWGLSTGAAFGFALGALPEHPFWSCLLVLLGVFSVWVDRQSGLRFTPFCYPEPP